MIGSLSIVIILFSVRKANILYRVVGSCFLFLGLLIWLMKAPINFEVLQHFDKLLGLLSLFFVLPFMSAVIKLGRYDLTLSGLMTRNSTNMGILYYKTSFTTYILTIFLNVATVPIIINSLYKKIHPLGKAFERTFFSQSILRPYALVLFWSPTEILVAVTINMTDQSYLALLPILWGMSFLFLFIDWWIHRVSYRNKVLPSTSEKSRTAPFSCTKKVIELIVSVLLFIGLVVVFNRWLSQGFLFVVTVVVIPFSFIWAAVLKGQKRFLKLGFLMIKENTNRLHGLFFLFLSAGFFIEMMPYTGIFRYMNEFLTKVHQEQSLFIFFLLIGLFIFCFSLGGIHPLVTIAFISPFLIGFVDELRLGLSITIIGASICTLMIGPFNVTPTVLSFHLKENPYRVIQKNLIFAVTFLLANVSLAYAVSL